MSPRRIARALLPFLLAAAPPCAATAAPSPKRGVCAQRLTADDWRALAPGVSWWYDWALDPDSRVPEGGPRFVPMLWGDAPGGWQVLELTLRARPRLRVLLVLNEPNMRSQGNLAPAAAARAWRRVKRLADRHGVPVVGPQFALGCPPGDCVSEPNPAGGDPVTYTWMNPYADAFLARLPKGVKPVLAIHPYGNVGELKWAVGEARKRSGGPVWVTEFNDWKAATGDAQLAYMKDAVAFMEASPDVAAYAWFVARSKEHPGISLLAPEPGKLTRLGEAYVALPGR